jgi:hypothetical protein
VLEVKRRISLSSVFYAHREVSGVPGQLAEVSTLNISQLFGDTDIDVVSFVSTSRLNWVRHVNRLDCKREVSQVFNYNPQGSRLR